MFLISEIVDPLGVELLIVLEYGIVPVCPGDPEPAILETTLPELRSYRKPTTATQTDPVTLPITAIKQALAEECCYSLVHSCVSL